MTKKRTRNYQRLLHNRSSDEYSRDNSKSILERSLKSNDIYDRDFYFVSSDSTDIYAKQLSDERWKEFSIIDDSAEVSAPDTSDILKILELERSINLLIEIEDIEFLHVVIFFTLIHNIYPKFSSELQDELDDIKIHLVHEIHEFQEGKKGMSRKSKITSSYQKFLTIELNLSEAYVKKHIRRYKKMIKSIFKN